MADANVDDCLACDLSSGRQDLPGGQIYATSHWAVEHCIGPFGVAFAEQARGFMAKTPAGIGKE